jgi:hypothetical protein
MNVEIETEAAQFPEKEYMYKWDFRCSVGQCRTAHAAQNFAANNNSEHWFEDNLKLEKFSSVQFSSDLTEISKTNISFLWFIRIKES